MDLATCARTLESKWGLAVSSVDLQGHDVDCAADVAASSLHAELERLVARAPAFQWREIRGHAVIFPRAPEWEQESQVEIADLSRVEAAQRFVEVLSLSHPVFAKLTGPVVKGDPNHALFSEQVRLSPKSDVITHLIELLGDNLRFALTVEPASEGRVVFHFHELAGNANP